MSRTDKAVPPGSALPSQRPNDEYEARAIKENGFVIADFTRDGIYCPICFLSRKCHAR
ncbi:hypothetical protein ML401_36595 (plasmid) [Bradyrhizobium sp. 62B]|uniref:hypothetical protein n=1 Tax=Bradyrhizobium sp. 62B TaxID=2898442 RepID=UPI00255807E9|nr:hypothetical protein ML401_36595 [Bradyrhizobium sp. 62B]